MKFIADLHIHSHFSLATSPRLNPEYLDYWGRVKGIKVIGTGDFTHPGWIKELKEKLEPAEPGLFKLKSEYKLSQDARELLPEAPETEPRFMLTAEISNIYKKGEKTRKIHNVIFAPDFETVEEIQQSIRNIDGNITSDGRPILGLDARDLLEMVLEASEDCFFVPAHIWTPWFSALGDKSGFNSIQNCYRDLTEHIHAVETGLSTDAPMHWMCKFLDKFTLISNSDAHSPQKLGRNANILDTELSYSDICSAIASGDPERFLGTIDLYPQNGKYYFDGHRKCSVRWDPVQTLKNDKICPECGKEVTVGVMNRVVELSTRTNLEERPNRLPFHSIIQLKAILSEIEDVGPKTKTVARRYNKIISKLGNELDILLNIPIEEIRSKASNILAEAIKRMRNREVFIQEGFDGEYGEITVFKPGEIQKLQSGRKIFDNQIKEERLQYKSQNLLNFSLEEYRKLERKSQDKEENTEEKSLKKLNSEQKDAVTYTQSHSLIKAGPGTGKTLTLIHKIKYLLENTETDPNNILAITFTNKAAQEIKNRLDNISEKNSNINVATFHKFGRQVIDENIEKTRLNNNYTLITNQDRKYILKEIFDLNKTKTKNYSQTISKIKQDLSFDISTDESKIETILNKYEKYKHQNNIIDLEDLLQIPYKLLSNSQELLKYYQNRYKWVLVDEYQDINNIQYELLQILTNTSQEHPKICAIGDPNQAIYGFRGASVEFINNFDQDFPNSKTIQLKKSYRCSDRILQTANALIQNNSDSMTGQGKGEKVKLLKNATGKSEAEAIARIIEKKLGGVRFFSIDSDVTRGSENQDSSSPGDYAILCRTKQQIPTIIEALENHGLPYQTVSKKPFFQKKPINNIIDILKLSLNTDNELLQTKIKQNYNQDMPDMKEIEGIIENKPTEESIIDIGNYLFNNLSEEKNRKIKRLASIGGNYQNIEDFLNNISLYTGKDMLQNNTETVSILTLHSSKGLEFERVFIIGCEDKIIPYSLFDKKSEVEEEKRLLYVGMTRAEKQLYLSYAQSRYISGKKLKNGPTPFLKTIDNKLKHASMQKKESEKKKKGDRQLKIF